MNLCSIDSTALMLLHAQCCKAYGGKPGVQDVQWLASALAYPLQQAIHAELDIAALAAAYGIGIIREQPFIDGNVRAAFLAIGIFLYANGWSLIASPADALLAMQAVAAGEMDEVMLADWIRTNV